jgi:hypothetical protein
MFEGHVDRRGKIWKWSVCMDEREVVMKDIEEHPTYRHLSSQHARPI